MLCILLAVPFVGLVVLSMCCIFSCCAIGWSRNAADIYVLCFFLAVPFVGLIVLSTCCVFYLLTVAVSFVGLVVLSMCCVFSCCAIGWSRSAADIYVLCFFPCCTIGWSQTDVYVLCIFLAVSFVGLVVLSMCCVFYLLCHLLVS